MAALSTVANGGLIPQARHGDRGVEALALPGSKFKGFGLEKEQIGHIQVAFESGKAVICFEGRKGLFALDTGDEDERLFVVVLLSARRINPWPSLSSFGWNVIFGEDFKKPG